ncbi:MAG TPA: two-component system VirA-like sensor kinase [Micropepsaceae bacterium]
MRIILAAMGVALLLLLLTWLLLRSTSPEIHTDQIAFDALDDMATSESALHRDMLRARAGMLNNYDPLVAEEDAIRDSISRLETAVRNDPQISDAVDQLAMTADLQEEWTEEFKASNALLHNSLAYFRLFSAELSESPRDPVLARQVSGLTAAMLHLTLDTSSSVMDEVDDELNRISTENLSPEDTRAVPAMLAHARMLRDLLPATDHTLKALFATRSHQQGQAIRVLVLARAAAFEQRASRYRYVLYGISLILVAMLIYLGVHLEWRARLLRRRANFEHIIARISTRFINAGPGELGAQVARALEEMAAFFGADRAYFIVTDGAGQIYRWSRTGIMFPHGWPQKALAVASRIGGWSNGIVHIAHDDQLAHGDGSGVPAAIGIREWLCIMDPKGEPFGGMLGFDALTGKIGIRKSEFGLCRMAFDAIAYAIDREFLEGERRRLEDKLQQAHRMETIGALASGVAHNFNNIVAAILGYAEMAHAQVKPGSRAAENVAEIRQAGERARDLVEHILTFGRRSDTSREHIPLGTLILETKSFLEATLPTRIKLVVGQVSDQSILISGELAQLQQVIMNICSNAAQAIDGAGTIEIEAGLTEVAAPLQLDHGRLAPGRYTVISVSDDGRGMDEATLERIFEPFFTTRADGNGLGLSTALEIVREHGGGIAVESKPRIGTRFEVWLPYSPAIQADTEQRAQRVAGRGGGQAVLVFEADRARLLKHEEILAALGYEPAGFTDVSEAIAACRASPGRFDIALLCHQHGKGSPLDLAMTVHRAVPDLSIILAVPWAADLAAPALAEAGVSEIVGLPLTSAELSGALAHCCETPLSRRRMREEA